MTGNTAAAITGGCTALGVELGSTNIKAVLVGPDHRPLASGAHVWENRLVDGLWTYPLDDVTAGLRGCVAALADDVRQRHGVELTTVGALGVSAMMHGYLALDDAGELLVPFRTWRNTNTGAAVERLSDELGHNIPHRWSVAHLYQAMLDDEEHLARLARLTTLAGYVHQRLTGQHVLGIGDASGMFPVDPATGSYDRALLDRFDALAREAGHPVSLADLLPAVRRAGQDAGELTEDGARWLDPTGTLRAGVPVCPPEGDAGTGMVATDSIVPATGNVSAGTSIFAMVVLDRPLSRVHRELDLVTTPAGDPVAMVHCNNGASELDAWIGMLTEVARVVDPTADRRTVFDALVRTALDGAPDGGGLMAFNHLSGEPILHTEHGRPLFARAPDSTLDLATFVRVQLYAALATLRIGMDVLVREEAVPLRRLFAHGGLFTTPGVAQRFLAAALETPVTVDEAAAAGGPWGMALLAAHRRRTTEGVAPSLADFLAEEVFADAGLETTDPHPDDVAGFTAFMTRHRAALPVERAAAEHL